MTLSALAVDGSVDFVGAEVDGSVDFVGAEAEMADHCCPQWKDVGQVFVLPHQPVIGYWLLAALVECHLGQGRSP